MENVQIGFDLPAKVNEIRTNSQIELIQPDEALITRDSSSDFTVSLQAFPIKIGAQKSTLNPITISR